MGVSIGVQQAWKNFLEQRGLTIALVGGVERAVSSSQAADTARDVCVDLNHLTAMQLVGPDATTFLQGYLTCDIKALTATRGLLGAYCNIKGRVVADAMVVLADGHPTLISHGSLRDRILDGLKKYLAFARSRFAPSDGGPILLGLLNPSDPELPVESLTTVPFRNGHAIALPG